MLSFVESVPRQGIASAHVVSSPSVACRQHHRVVGTDTFDLRASSGPRQARDDRVAPQTVDSSNQSIDQSIDTFDYLIGNGRYTRICYSRFE